MKSGLALVLIGSLACGLPYPHQLALTTPSPVVSRWLPEDRIVVSGQPLYRVKGSTGVVAGVACYGPLRYLPVEGPIGTLVFVRSGHSVTEVEAILRPALSQEELAAIEAVVPAGTLLFPCQQDVLRIAPLAQLPFDAETSISYGRDSQSTDLLVIRLRVAGRDEANVRGMIASAVGIVFELTYRVSGYAESHSAIVQVRSGTGSVR